MVISKIRNILGKPYYESPNCILYNSDCLDAMKRIYTPFIQLTVTSPPYNIGKEYEKIQPLHEYLSWCEGWIAEVYKLTLANGAFWLNLGYFSIPGKAKAIPISYLIWERIPFFLIQEVVWNYGAGVAGKKFLSPRNEKFLWYVKNEKDYVFNLDDIRDPNVKYPNQKKNGRIKNNPIGKNPTDVWQFPKVTSGYNRASKERTSHPAQFPEAVIKRIIKASSDTGNIIFDPFMGSGTTAVTALELNRSVIGIEISSDYCQIAADRIDNFLVKSELPKMQMSLF